MDRTTWDGTCTCIGMLVCMLVCKNSGWDLLAGRQAAARNSRTALRCTAMYGLYCTD